MQLESSGYGRCWPTALARRPRSSRGLCHQLDPDSPLALDEDATVSPVKRVTWRECGRRSASTALHRREEACIVAVSVLVFGAACAPARLAPPWEEKWRSIIQFSRAGRRR